VGVNARGECSFRVGLTVLLPLAAAVRIVYALEAAPEPVFLDDDTFFHLTGRYLAEGKGYVQPLPLTFSGESNPTAEHPPGYPLLLSLVGRLADSGVDMQRMAGVLTGTLTVLAVALIARRLAGARAGLIAGALCAAYPSFIAADAALMSESLFGTLVAFSLLQTLRLREHWTLAGSAVLGVLLGLATLTRTEAALLVPLLALCLLRGRRPRAPAIRRAALVTLAAVAVVAPWVARNWDVFGEPILSGNVGTTLSGANCPRTYNDDVGGWSIACVDEARRGLSPTLDEASQSAHMRDEGLDFAFDHAGRALVVGGVRVGRVWGVLQPRKQATVSGRRRGTQRAGVVMYYALVVGAVFGIVSLRRRRSELLILATPLVVTTITAFLTWGLVRIRHEAEVVILVLAGVGLSGILTSLCRRWGPAGPRRSARGAGSRISS
jgi:4-amino-4-deoxy-L-arabinose transferase-like glycosyltransferase